MHSYTVTTSPDTKTRFDTRKAAITAAREASSQSRHPVKVVRNDGAERMIYQRGEMTEATYVTTDRRGREERLA